jgi:phosphatidylglycerophosphate synthase
MDVIILASSQNSLENRFFQVPVAARMANEFYLWGVKKLTLVVDCAQQSARAAIERSLLSGLTVSIESAEPGADLFSHALSLAPRDSPSVIIPDGILLGKPLLKAIMSQKLEPGSAVQAMTESCSSCAAILLGPGGAEAARALEGAEHLPRLRLSGRAVSVREHSRKAIDDFLIDGLRKTVDSDGVVAFYLMRPITLRLTRLLSRTPILPNHVTLLSFVIGMTGVGLVAFGDRWLAALGGLLFFVAATTDCIDGEIARLRYKMSYLGGWLDTFTDDIQTSSCILACGYYASRHGMGEIWLILGVAAAAAFALPQIYVYFDIHRRYHSSDTVDFKFAWEKAPAPCTSESPASLAGVLKYSFKRDFFTMLFGLLIALELQTILVAVNLAANVTRAVMVGISAIMALRQRESA